jgi:hypothetical protein
MTKLTREQEIEIIQKSLEADERGDHDESVRLIQQMPLAPHLARAAKKIWGKEYLLQSGFDLSEAEAAYGKDWLN